MATFNKGDRVRVTAEQWSDTPGVVVRVPGDEATSDAGPATTYAVLFDGSQHPVAPFAEDELVHLVAETGTPYVSPSWTGAITQCSDCGNDAADEPCKRVHNKPDGPLCQPCRNGQLMVHLFCWHCGSDMIRFMRGGIVEWTTVVRFTDDDEVVVDDHKWDSDSTGDGDTWVGCSSCGTVLLRDVSYDIAGDDEPPIRQTVCRHCGLDIEGTVGEADWRDRGNNMTCPTPKNTGRQHEPVAEGRYEAATDAEIVDEIGGF